MKAEELRIGNWFKYKDLEKIKSIYRGENFKIIPDDIKFLFEGHNCDWVEPIPLTEEILLKCRFEKVKNKDKEGLREYIGHTAQKARYAIFGTDIFITKVDKRSLLWRSVDCDFMVLFYHKSIPIKYLHQLQNLYFALTGEELEINL